MCIKDTDKYTENEQNININSKWSHDVSVLCEILSVDFSPTIPCRNAFGHQYINELFLVRWTFPASLSSNADNISNEDFAWFNRICQTWPICQRPTERSQVNAVVEGIIPAMTWRASEAFKPDYKYPPIYVSSNSGKPGHTQHIEGLHQF